MPAAWRGPLKAARYILLASIVAFLAYRLTQIGWNEIAGALPANPLFYILSVAVFLVLPVSEMLNYRLLTGGFIPDGLRIFSRKRVLNDAIVGFAGEAYLYSRLVKMPDFDQRRALTVIKDNNLVSALISNSWTILLVVSLVMVGRADILDRILNLAPILVASFAIICLILFALAMLFFGRISNLTRKCAMQLATVHGAKVLVAAALQVAQWASALPTAAATTWLLLLTIQLLLRRIPGLPNADLFFLGVGISLAGFVGDDAVQLTAMLLAATAATQIIQLFVFVTATNSRSM